MDRFAESLSRTHGPNPSVVVHGAWSCKMVLLTSLHNHLLRTRSTAVRRHINTATRTTTLCVRWTVSLNPRPARTQAPGLVLQKWSYLHHCLTLSERGARQVNTTRSPRPRPWGTTVHRYRERPSVYSPVQPYNIQVTPARSVSTGRRVPFDT